MAKHEQFFALPVEEKQKLDVALTQRKTTKQCAELLKADGYFTDTTVPTLARALREYRTDTITIHNEARRQAFEKHADSRTRARVRELIDAYEIHASWAKMIKAAEATHWKLLDTMSKAGAAVALSDRVRTSSLTLSKLYADYTAFLMTSGLIPKAPTVHHILAANLIIRDEKDAGQVLEALVSFVNRTPDVHPHLPQAAAGIQRMLEAPKPEPLSEDAARVLAEMRAELAKGLAEKRAALRSPVEQPIGQAEIVETDEHAVPVVLDDGEDEPVHRRSGVVIQGELVDDMPRLEDIW